MTRDRKLYLNDIWESILAVEEYVLPLTKKDFLSNQQVQDAVIRRLEIIGEAVKNLDENFKKSHDGIPWKNIAGMRDIITHEYFGVKLERIWEVIKSDLPSLKQKFLSILQKED